MNGIVGRATGPRTAVVTGASSGIGRETAKALAAAGWRVIGVGRDPVRSAAAEADIRGAAQGAGVDMLRADLSLMSEVLRTAAAVAALTDRIHLLVNNAGGMTRELVMTAEGLEQNFAGNHLGPFLLTLRLLPLLRRAAAGAAAGSVRIVGTTSDASEMVPGFDWEDIQSLRNWNPGVAYCRGKLANVLFTRALAARLAADGIVAHAAHPGAVDSNFAAQAGEAMLARFKTMSLYTAAQGADTVFWLATADEPGRSSGGYWFQRQPRRPNPLAEDPAAADRLWQASERLLQRWL